MDPLTFTAASGLRSRMEALDMLANNLANADTGGYKADREFYTLYLSAEAADGAAAAGSPASVLPLIERPWTDFSQGALRVTSNGTDLAISGKGFFAVDGPSGPLYTRNGAFRLSAAGNLVTAEGYPLRSTGGPPVQLRADSPFEVLTDGTVSQAGQIAGSIEIVDFPNAEALAKRGENYFFNSDPKAVPVRAASAQVHQGKLEGSNVGTAEAAVRLVSVMRQFEMLQKAIVTGGEMNRHAIEEVARVNP